MSDFQPLCPGSERVVAETWDDWDDGYPGSPFGTTCPVCAARCHVGPAVAYAAGPILIASHPARPLPPHGCRFFYRDRPGLWQVEGHYSDGTALRAVHLDDSERLDISLYDIVFYARPENYFSTPWPRYTES